MSYSGGWRRWVSGGNAAASVRLHPNVDPEHLDPDPNTIETHWQQDTAQRSLPDELVGGQYILPPVAGGPVDMTPETHDFGEGVGHGESTLAAQDERGRVHSEDYGSVDARRYIAADSRDGAWHVDVIQDARNAGDSPAQLERKRTGVEGVNDPGARLAQRIWRWRDRWIDRHMWGVDFRPSLIRNAYSAPNAAAQGNGDQYTSPAPLYGWSGQAGIGTPDQFRVAQVRRVPRPWDEEMATDGTGTGGVTTDGLTVWGL